jgi:hypothetical protein
MVLRRKAICRQLIRFECAYLAIDIFLMRREAKKNSKPLGIIWGHLGHSSTGNFYK